MGRAAVSDLGLRWARVHHGPQWTGQGLAGQDLLGQSLLVERNDGARAPLLDVRLERAQLPVAVLPRILLLEFLEERLGRPLRPVLQPLADVRPDRLERVLARPPPARNLGLLGPTVPPPTALAGCGQPSPGIGARSVIGEAAGASNGTGAVFPTALDPVAGVRNTACCQRASCSVWSCRSSRTGSSAR